MIGDRHHVIASVLAGLEEAGYCEVAVTHLAMVVERKLNSNLCHLRTLLSDRDTPIASKIVKENTGRYPGTDSRK